MCLSSGLHIYVLLLFTTLSQDFTVPEINSEVVPGIIRKMLPKLPSNLIPSPDNFPRGVCADSGEGHGLNPQLTGDIQT